MVRQVTALTCAAILTMLIAFTTARAQAPPSRSAGQSAPAPAPADSRGEDPASPGDQQFVVQAAMGNMAEVQLGHLATEKARRANVKKFAQTMIDDHLKAQQELADAASGSGIKWPKQLDESHQQLRRHLSSVEKDQFDRHYMKAVVDGHRDVESLLAARVGERGSKAGETRGRSSGAATADETTPVATRVNDWAEKTLPAVRARLKQAEQVLGELDTQK